MAPGPTPYDSQPGATTAMIVVALLVVLNGLILLDMALSGGEQVQLVLAELQTIFRR